MTDGARSVRRTLLAQIVPALGLIALLGGTIAYGLARYASQSALDHWLQDSATTLASRVHRTSSGIVVDIARGAREILEWDELDRVYFEVLSADGTRHFGDIPIPDPPARPEFRTVPVFYDARIGTTPVRVVALRLDDAATPIVIVKVAETRLKRRALAGQVLWISVVISVLLALASSLMVWFAISRGTHFLQAAVERARRSSVRAPLQPINIDHTMPEEVRPLVQDINALMENLHGAHLLNRQFIANAAHQLRTPIASLRVQLEVAHRETDPAKHQHAIADAVRLLDRLGRMLHQLLILARTDDAAAGTELPDRADIDRVAREELERRLDDCAELGIDLGYEGTTRPVIVPINEDLIREAVANLLDNAIRYGAAGKHVTIGVQAEPALLYVEDSGPGIPSSEYANLGKRFYRVPGTTGDGCGLGISIVDAIARQAGGRLVLSQGAGNRGLRATIAFDEPTATPPR